MLKLPPRPLRRAIRKLIPIKLERDVRQLQHRLLPLRGRKDGGGRRGGGEGGVERDGEGEDRVAFWDY